METKPTYRAPALEEHEAILRALDCCDKARCSECPYEQGYYECEHILAIAQETIRKLARLQQERIEAVLGTICDGYCKYRAECDTQEELNGKCTRCSLGKWLEDMEWRR
ncbi:MAG: hypothetical protein ACI4PM_08245 [Butyricicoccus sp.]